MKNKIQPKKYKVYKRGLIYTLPDDPKYNVKNRFISLHRMQGSNWCIDAGSMQNGIPVTGKLTVSTQAMHALYSMFMKMVKSKDLKLKGKMSKSDIDGSAFDIENMTADQLTSERDRLAEILKKGNVTLKQCERYDKIRKALDRIDIIRRGRNW